MANDPLADVIEMTFKEARKEGLSVADAAKVVAQAMRHHLEERGTQDAKINREMISVQSIFGAKTGLPLVDFKYGLEHFTLSVEQSREHAMAILTCAEAAMMDAAVFRWLTIGAVGLPQPEAAQAIGELRRFRGDVDREDWRNEEQKRGDGLA